MQIFANANYDFLKWRWRAVAFSTVFILVGLVLFLTGRGASLGVDFAGGATVILRFQDKVPVDQLRATLKDAMIQQYGKASENSVQLRLPKQEREFDYAGQVVSQLSQRLNGDLGSRLDLNLQGRAAIAELLKSKDPDKKGSGPSGHDYYYNVATNVIAKRSEVGIFRSMNEVKAAAGVTPASAAVLEQAASLGKFTILSQETVGPQIGRQLQTKALWAILLSVLAMGVYIAIRFDLKFGVAAIVCLIHDVLISLAFLMMIRGEFLIITVASLLMVIGYSINDAVVVYDRVRENLKKAKKENFEDVLNRSLNQTLSRTILTGGSVMIVLVSLIVFGGEVINEFAWLLLIGTIAGTYSTLTIVPAVVIAWHRRATEKKTSDRPAVAAVRTDSSVEAPRKRAKA